MPGRAFQIRYPDNTYEIHARTESPPPSIGDTLRGRGKLWKVTSTTHGVPMILRVEPVEERRKGSSSIDLGGDGRPL
jgi:hypothetical protein